MTSGKLREVYILIDPLTQQIRYVGQSKNARVRYSQHLRDAERRPRNYRVYNWINHLTKLNQKPILRIIELTNDPDSSETYWIEFFRNSGFDLCNHTNGGKGPNGKIHSEEFKQMISHIHKGKIVSAEVGRKISKVKKGKPTAPEYCGVNSYKATLTEDQVRLIRSFPNEIGSTELSRKLGLAFHVVNRVRLRQTYKYVV